MLLWQTSDIHHVVNYVSPITTYNATDNSYRDQIIAAICYELSAVWWTHDLRVCVNNVFDHGRWAGPGVIFKYLTLGQHASFNRMHIAVFKLKA